MISWSDALLFGPPLLIGLGGWVTVRLCERNWETQRLREQQQRAAAE